MRKLCRRFDRFEPTRAADGRVIIDRPDGEVKTYTKEDFIDHPISAYQSYYTDSRVAAVTVPECPPGTVTEAVTVTRERRPDMFRCSTSSVRRCRY